MSCDFQKGKKENFVCWSNITLWKADGGRLGALWVARCIVGVWVFRDKKVVHVLQRHACRWVETCRTHSTVYPWWWMIEEWRRVKLLVLWASWVNGYIIFYINIWTWECYPQNGCRDCSQLTKNEIVWGVPRTICSSFSGIHRTLGVVSSLWTKHGYTTTLLRPRNSENNGFPMGSLHQRRWTPFLQRGRIWWQTFGICKEQFRSTIWKRVKLLQVHPIHRYWTVWKSSCKKNVHDWPTKNPFPTQRTSSLLWSCGRKIDGVRVPTRSTSPLFSRFGSLGLLLVLQYEKMAGSISTPIWRRVQ